jgi:hypothetical protein
MQSDCQVASRSQHILDSFQMFKLRQTSHTWSSTSSPARAGDDHTARKQMRLTSACEFSLVALAMITLRGSDLRLRVRANLLPPHRRGGGE